MIKRFLVGAAITLGLALFAPAAYADGPYGGAFPDPTDGQADKNFKYLGLGPASAILNQERLLTFSSQFATIDNGAGNTYTVDLNTVPITKGGTNATNAQDGVNNLLGGISGTPAVNGDLAVFDGTNWALLHKGSHANGELLTLVSGSPDWSVASASAPTGAQYITLALDAGLSAERVLQGTANKITLTDGGANGNLTLNVGTDITQNTSVQTLTNKTLTSPSIGSSLIFELGTFDTTVTATAPAAARAANIPDFGTSSADFLMTQGAQTKAGILTLSNAPVLSTSTLTAGANLITFPSSAQTLVGRTSADVLTNKELTAPSLTSGSTLILKQSSANYTIDWANPAAARAYHIREVVTDADFAMLGNNEAYVAGGAVYSNANTLKITAAGTSGHPLISGGTGAPAFNILGTAGGGTGISSYTAGDLLTVNDAGTLVKLAGSGTNGYVLTYNSANNPNVGWASSAAATVAVVKPINEIVNNSATLQNDDHLFFPVAANETWVFDMTIIHTQGNNSGDADFTIVGPSGSAVGFTALNQTLAVDLANSSGFEVFLNGATGATYCTHFWGYIINGSTPGNLQFQFAQNVAHASNLTVVAGSHLKGVRQ